MDDVFNNLFDFPFVVQIDKVQDTFNQWKQTENTGEQVHLIFTKEVLTTHVKVSNGR